MVAVELRIYVSKKIKVLSIFLLFFFDLGTMKAQDKLFSYLNSEDRKKMLRNV